MSVRVSHCRLVASAMALAFLMSCADPFLHALPEIPPLGPPHVSTEHITHIITRVGQVNRVRGDAGAVLGAAKEIRFWSHERAGELLGFVTDIEVDGSFAEVPLPGSEQLASAHLWISTVDYEGIERWRVYARGIEQTLNLAGRVPYSSYPTPVALYAFAADKNPRSIHPATGALYGEASAADSVAAAVENGRRALFGVGPETRNAPNSWTFGNMETGPSRGRGETTAMVYDTARGVVVLFSGGVGGENYFDSEGTWEYNGNTWTEVAPGKSPSPRLGHAMTFDTIRAVPVLFGGHDNQEAWESETWEDRCRVLVADTWEYDGYTWTEVSPATAPSPRFFHAMVYDNARGVAVLFGGLDTVGGPDCWTALSDTWEYDGNTWTQVTPEISPPARALHAMAYDAARAVVVLFGGSADVSDYLSDTWEYDGKTWTEVGWYAGASAPSRRNAHAIAYDANRTVSVLFGGQYDYNDTWEYDGNTWREITLETPSPQEVGAMAYDANRGVTVLFEIETQWETWEYQTYTPHARTAAHSIVFPLHEVSPDLVPLKATYVGAGVGDNGDGSARPGVELLIWDWVNKESVSLGSHTAFDTASISERTIVGSPPPPLSNYVNRGRIWLLATPMYPSSEPGGAGINSEIHTDYVELQVSYTIP
ncbi:kelch repeat-containing protein [Myxococcota bacterium]